MEFKYELLLKNTIYKIRARKNNKNTISKYKINNVCMTFFS